MEIKKSASNSLALFGMNQEMVNAWEVSRSPLR